MSTHHSEPLDETVWDMLMLGLSTGMSPRGESLVLTEALTHCTSPPS